MVLKEWACKDCGTDFEGLLPVCPECGNPAARRAFRTPVSINQFKHKFHDQIIESEMRVRGMTNYSNRDNRPTPTFSGKVQVGEVRGSWGPEALQGYVTATGAPLAPPNIAMQQVTAVAGQNIRNQNGVNRVMQRSVSLGRTDMKGNQIPIKTLPV